MENAATGQERNYRCVVCHAAFGADERAVIPVGREFVHIPCLPQLPTEAIADELARTIDRDGCMAVVSRIRWAALDYTQPLRSSLIRLAGAIERELA